MTKTYTGRTQSENGVYARCRKSLIYMMGHRGVEPRTSRLSGPPNENSSTYTQSEIRATPASRHFREQKRTALISSSTRTQSVHRQRKLRNIIAIVGSRLADGFRALLIVEHGSWT